MRLIAITLIAAALLAGDTDTRWTETTVVERLLVPEFPGSRDEVRLWDNSRVDLLWEDYAIEVDWDKKWAEGIGQALYYAAVLENKPGVVLIRRDDSTDRYVWRAQAVCAEHGIRLWVYDLEDRRLWP